MSTLCTSTGGDFAGVTIRTTLLSGPGLGVGVALSLSELCEAVRRRGMKLSLRFDEGFPELLCVYKCVCVQRCIHLYTYKTRLAMVSYTTSFT